MCTTLLFVCVCVFVCMVVCERDSCQQGSWSSTFFFFISARARAGGIE